ncbi:Bug family tripartite tricarboxylate transporter substrate binding protein [Martelella sp. AMO21009]
MSKISRRTVLLSTLPALLLATSQLDAVAADAFPDHDIKMIVPVSAGGGTDLVARTVAQLLEKELGVSIVIENVPGGSGTIGLNQIAEAKPDGYTMGIWSNRGMITSVMLGQGVKFDENSFEYLAGVNVTADLLIASPGSPFTNAKELVGYAQEHPGEVLVGVPGIGPLVTYVLAQNALDVNLTPLRFKGGSETLTAVLGDTINTGVLTAQFAETAADQNMPVLGVASDERIESIPDVPTFKEQGFDFSGEITRIFFLPKGVPDDVVQKYVAAFDAIAEGPLPEALRKINEVPLYRGQAAIESYLNKDFAQVRQVIEDNRDQFVGQ